jgi:hypothetical protein
VNGTGGRATVIASAWNYTLAIHAAECNDGLDADGDGLVDYPADPGCDSPTDLFEKSPALVCDDGVDNDGDEHIDYPADPGCDSLTDPFERTPALVCDDGVDNDGDGRIDYPTDPSCTDPADASEVGTAACDNNVDDDGDGRIDHPADPGCTDLADASELGTAGCDNGADDDADGRIDYPADPGCRSLVGLEDPQCQDGLNNDGTEDALIDFDGGQSIYGPCSGGVCPPGVSDPNHDGVADPDPNCGGPADNNEMTPSPLPWGCGIGPELLLLGPLLAAARRRPSSAAPRPRREA